VCKNTVSANEKVKMKEPTGKHPNPAKLGWMKREMRKPFRIMFWVLVVLMGVGLVGKLIVSVGTRDSVRKPPTKPVRIREERRFRKPQTKRPAKKRRSSYWEERRERERREREKQRQEAERRESVEAPPIISDVTPEEIERLFGIWSELTILQKGELFKNNYKRKWVEWTGKVWSVASYTVWFEYKLSSDPIRTLLVSASFGESAKRTLLQLRNGQRVTYQGRIQSCKIDLDHRCLDVSLEDARIVEIH